MRTWQVNFSGRVLEVHMCCQVWFECALSHVDSMSCWPLHIDVEVCTTHVLDLWVQLI